MNRPRASLQTNDDVPRRTSGTIDERLERIWKRAYCARTRDDLRRLYSDWAPTYDEDHRHVGFAGHRVAADLLARLATRLDARILDAGAGTGAVGQALADKGYSDITAVDLSPEMLARAEAKGVYGKVLRADLSMPVDGLRSESFDAAVLVGVFSYGQAPAAALDEIHRVVRPGGVVVITMRTDYFREDPDGVRAALSELERSGSWNLIERTPAAPYLPKKDEQAEYRVWAWRITGKRTIEAAAGFRDAVADALAGAGSVKVLDHSWIWDSIASRLYDRYTQSEGYYLTDCELEILERHASDIVGEEDCIVELGCGSALKIRRLLSAALQRGRTKRPTYMPIDVSAGALESTVDDLSGEFGECVAFVPRQGLFADVLHTIPEERHKLVLFFGSSLGNIPDLARTVEFLEGLRSQLRDRDRLVIGLDLHKDEQVLDAAYNREASCREFFVHMLRRINDALGADFDPRVFELASNYVREEPFRGLCTHRMNLRVSPTRDQRSWIRELDREVVIRADDVVQVGISRKFEPHEIDALAHLSGFSVARRWLDSRGWFALTELVLDPR